MPEVVLLRQASQVRSTDTYDSSLPAGITLETDAVTLEDNLNSERSQRRRIIDPNGNSYDDPVLPLALSGTKKRITGPYVIPDNVTVIVAGLIIDAGGSMELLGNSQMEVL